MPNGKGKRSHIFSLELSGWGVGFWDEVSGGGRRGDSALKCNKIKKNSRVKGHHPLRPVSWRRSPITASVVNDPGISNRPYARTRGEGLLWRASYG